MEKVNKAFGFDNPKNNNRVRKLPGGPSDPGLTENRQMQADQKPSDPPADGQVQTDPAVDGNGTPTEDTNKNKSTSAPTNEPTPATTNEPTPAPTKEPTPAPTKEPAAAPTKEPAPAPTKAPTPAPTGSALMTTSETTDETVDSSAEETTNADAISGTPLSIDLLPIEVNVTVTKLSSDEAVGLGSFGTYFLSGSTKYLKRYLNQQNDVLLNGEFDTVSLRLTRLQEQLPPSDEQLDGVSVEAKEVQVFQVNVTAVMNGSILFQDTVSNAEDLPSTALIHMLQLNAFGLDASALSSGDGSVVFSSEYLWSKDEAHSTYLNSLRDFGWEDPYLSNAEQVYTGISRTITFTDNTGLSGDSQGRDSTANSVQTNEVSNMVQIAGISAGVILALSVLLVGLLFMKKSHASSSQEKTHTGSYRESSGSANNPANFTTELSISPSNLSKDVSKESSKQSSKKPSPAVGGGSLEVLNRASKQIEKAEKGNKTKTKVQVFQPAPTRNVYQDYGGEDEGYEVNTTAAASTRFQPRIVNSSANSSIVCDESTVGEYTYNEQFTICGDDNMSIGYSLEGDADLDSVL